MPCFQIQTVSVEFKAANWNLLERAIKSLGWQYTRTGDTVSLKGGAIALDLARQKAVFNTGLQGDVNALKVAYSRAAIVEIGRRNRWPVQFASTNRGVFQKSF